MKKNSELSMCYSPLPYKKKIDKQHERTTLFISFPNWIYVSILSLLDSMKGTRWQNNIYKLATKRSKYPQNPQLSKLATG